MNDSAWDRDWHKWCHESCDKLGLPYDTSFEDFTLALSKRLYPNGVSYLPNRAERRKYKDEQIIADVMKSGFASSNWELVRTRVNDLKDRQYHVKNLEELFK